MKNLQKLILPLLIVLIVFIIYTLYFGRGVDLGSFDDFDPNNNAVKEIRVKVLPNQNINSESGSFPSLSLTKMVKHFKLLDLQAYLRVLERQKPLF